jgi:hypothetical protein
MPAPVTPKTLLKRAGGSTAAVPPPPVTFLPDEPSAACTDSADADCSICLEKMVLAKADSTGFVKLLMALSCGLVFHWACIHRWLQVRS